MLNAEKFKEEIEKLNYDFALVGNKVVKCTITTCDGCSFKIGCRSEVIKWLTSEYEEPKIEPEVYDLKCDDKVEVSHDGVIWHRQHFSRISSDLKKPRQVIVWANGMTSWSAPYENENQISRTFWEYARIPREE